MGTLSLRAPFSKTVASVPSDSISFMRLVAPPQPLVVRIGDDDYVVTTGPVAAIDHERRILVIPVSSRDLTRAVADAVCLAWRERLDAYATAMLEHWTAFETAVDVVFDPDIELNEDDGPGFIAAFDRLVKMGVRFDPRFAVDVSLCRRMTDPEMELEDIELDVDDGFERDDPNEDGSDMETDGEPIGAMRGIGKKATKEWLERNRRDRDMGMHGSNIQHALPISPVLLHRPVWISEVRNAFGRSGFMVDGISEAMEWFDGTQRDLLLAITEHRPIEGHYLAWYDADIHGGAR